MSLARYAAKADHRCVRCGVVKPLAEFYPRSDRPLGVTSFCKQCHRKTGRAFEPAPRSNCVHCGDEFRRTTREGGRVQVTCSRACSFKVRDTRGEKNPNWRNNATERNLGGRFTAAYRKWRLSVLERDGHKCTSCGSTNELHADHIEPWVLFPESRYEVRNGQTLCKWCHIRKTQADCKVRARKRDANEPEIVEALRKAGYGVWLLNEPCDLLVHHPRWGQHFRTLEVKMPNRVDGGFTPRNDQPKQRAFVELTNTPYVTTPFEALLAMGETVEL